jgi:hypothetical protein
MYPTLESYVVCNYVQFMSRQEWMAYNHLVTTMKITHGASDKSAQEDARTKSESHLSTMLSDDPEVLQLASRGMPAFMEQTARRILAEHKDQVFLNYCPACGALARTPKARQCARCKHDWHDVRR